MERKDLLVAAGVTAVLGLGWYQFVWQAQGKAATKANAEVQAAQDRTSKLRTQVATLERTKADLAARAGLKDQLDQAIPAAPDLSSLVKQLQALAGQREVLLTSIANGGVVAPVDPASSPTTTIAGAKPALGGTPASSILLTLAMNGDYQKVLLFTNDLATLPRLVVVESVLMTPVQATQTPGKAVSAGNSVSATIVARVYTTALPAGAAAAGASAAPGGGPTTTVAGGPTTTASKGGQ